MHLTSTTQENGKKHIKKNAEHEKNGEKRENQNAVNQNAVEEEAELVLPTTTFRLHHLEIQEQNVPMLFPSFQKNL